MLASFASYELAALPSEWFSPDAWMRAFAKLQNHRAVPVDSASVIAWKSHAADFAPLLSKIAIDNLCGERVCIPPRWCSAQLVWIAKPSKPPTTPENLRSLGLMAPDCKAFLHLLKERACPFVLEEMRKYPQFAYRQGTSTYDSILRASSHCHKVRETLENHKGDLTSKLLQRNEAELKGGIMCSLDLSKAFDLVDHASLYASLLATNMPRNLAAILVDLHCRTRLTILHGGSAEHFGMSRGLRQGCPVAPMLYAAWVCKLCCDLNAQIDEHFTSNHMSIFADDKHLFWEVHSKHQFLQAIRQLKQVINILEQRRMQVSFQKSAVVYALRGRVADEMAGRNTCWHSGSRYFVLRWGTRCVRLPLQDRLEYLGTILSYGSFEMQTAVHRAAKATQNFKMLTKPLRTTGPLSLAQRLRIYKACVLTSLVYGLTATGFSSGSLRHVCSVAFVQLRKVLRKHERGTTHSHVFSSAGLDIHDTLRSLAAKQVSSIRQRMSGVDVSGTWIELSRSEQILLQLNTFSSQASSDCLHALVDEQTTKVACPECGQYFMGDYGLLMHIKAKHPRLNQISKIDFVRSQHSLFGTSICRFCRSRCYNWQALEKHIAEGGCSRIKDAFSRGISLESLMREIVEDEKANPPEPPGDILVDDSRLVDSGHAVLTCPLRDVPKHADAFEKIRTTCGLCGQRVRDTITLKIHWRQIHPAAWEATRTDAESTAKSLCSIFRSPCQFCGVNNKNPQAHATRCSAFFQVTALRALIHQGRDRSSMEGVRKQRPRQHERQPAYASWSIASTPLGKAFGTSRHAERASKNGSETEGVNAITFSPVSSSLPVSTTNNPQHKATHTLLRFFRVTGQGRARNGAEEEGSGSGSRDVPWTCRLRLRNPHSLCYVNSSVCALLHLLQELDGGFGNLCFLHQAGIRSINDGTILNLSSNLMFRSLISAWRYADEQCDAAEYCMLLLEALNMLRCSWVLLDRTRLDHPPLERGGNPLMVALPVHACSLQDAIDAWSCPEPGRLRAVSHHDRALLIQLDRYNDGRKLFTPVTFEADVLVPTLAPSDHVEPRAFRVVSLVFHTGQTVRAGHYQALLRVGSSWSVCDDGVEARPFTLNEHILRNVYLLMLVSC